jgi:putative redox protein
MGGKNEGVRPMEMILMGLASCSSLDVLHILHKGKSEVTNLEVDVKAERANAIPAVFTNIHLHFKAKGDFTTEKLERAINLSMEKYCSVTKMLESTVNITTSFEIVT